MKKEPEYLGDFGGVPPEGTPSRGTAADTERSKAATPVEDKAVRPSEDNK